MIDHPKIVGFCRLVESTDRGSLVCPTVVRSVEGKKKIMLGFDGESQISRRRLIFFHDAHMAHQRITHSRIMHRRITEE